MRNPAQKNSASVIVSGAATIAIHSGGSVCGSAMPNDTSAVGNLQELGKA